MKRWAKRTIIVGFVVLLTIGISGCREKGAQVAQSKKFLNYYTFNEVDNALRPLIQDYESKNKGVRIVLHNFTDLEEYEDRIINEMAEGAGPDMFSIHNTWMKRHQRKISPLPLGKLTLERFREAFVNVTATDLLGYDAENTERIYALPLTVDTLAIYYNKAHYEDKIPTRGKPPQTWEELKDDVFKLTKSDNSFERFDVAGIALGRGDNIMHAVDILYLLLLQHKTDFYNQDHSKAIFAERQGSLGGSGATPGAEALALFSSFAKEDNKNFSWNEYLADDDSELKEIEAFAKGKVSMFVGYAADYERILNTLNLIDNKGSAPIRTEDIGVAPIPQVFNPESETRKRDTYASYFAETVSRTSRYPNEAWDFLMFLATRKSQEHYFDKTHRPTSRRDLIEEQKKHPIYGVFATQLGYAESLQIYKANKYKDIFTEALQEAFKTDKAIRVLQEAQGKINELLN